MAIPNYIYSLEDKFYIPIDSQKVKNPCAEEFLEYNMPETENKGPWDLEPNVQSGRHENYPWIILKNGNKILCGYILIDKCTEVSIDQIDLEIKIHGGITFHKSIEHPTPGRIIGFDCGHSHDYKPTLSEIDNLPKTEYKNTNYVFRELIYLIKQLRSFQIKPFKFNEVTTKYWNCPQSKITFPVYVQKTKKYKSRLSFI